MSTKTLTKDNFEQTVLAEGITIVDFWASWCGPCRMFAPVFEQAATVNADIVFGKVDTEAEQELAAGLQISSIPTIMAFRDGVLLYSQPGAMGAASFDQLIQAVRDVDMEEVHAQIAARTDDASA
jgi:thioredoxin 1